VRITSSATAVILAVLAFAGCGPTYRIYNGGSISRHREAPASARELAPTEAGVVFSSDYAPPEKNAQGAGPTNRVATDVPATMEPHYFVALSTSTAPQGASYGGGSGTAGVNSHVMADADAGTTRLVSGQEAANLLADASREAGVRNTTALAAGGYSSAKPGFEESNNVDSPSDSAAAAAQSTPTNAQDVGTAAALTSPRKASQALDTGEARGPIAYGKSSAGKIVADGRAPTEAADNLVAKGQAEANATQDVGGAGQPLDASNANAAAGDTISKAAAAHEAPAGTAGYGDVEAVKLAAERNETVEIGDARLILATSQTKGYLSYKRFQSSVAAATIESGRAVAGSLAPAERAAAANAQETGTAAAASDATKAASGADVTAPQGAFAGETSRAPKADSWTKAPEGIYKVSPPGLSAVKESRLITQGGIQELLKEGLLKAEPASAEIICYRIYVTNPTESKAANVRILDRLDERTALIADAVYTSSGASKVGYDKETRALEVVLPELAASAGFVVEYYVELQPAQ
jgi:uncharacterized repeat protein (TIGR01451 family)